MGKSAEEWAEEAHTAVYQHITHYPDDYSLDHDAYEAMMCEMFAKAMEQARAEERERCAILADAHASDKVVWQGGECPVDPLIRKTAKTIAEAIRSQEKE